MNVSFVPVFSNHHCVLCLSSDMELLICPMKVLRAITGGVTILSTLPLYS